MTSHTSRGSLPASHNFRRGARPAPETFADPATSEEDILYWGIASRAAFAAAMSRPNKGPTLLGLLTSHAIGALYQNMGFYTSALLTLVSDPGLRAHDLRAVAHQCGDSRISRPLLTAICAHPNTELGTLVTMLYRVTPRTAGAVSQAIASLLPSVVAWVMWQVDMGGTPNAAIATADQLNLITQTRGRWDTWAAGDPARVRFLQASSFDFTDEGEMFAAGAALCAAPGRTDTPAAGL